MTATDTAARTGTALQLQLTLRLVLQRTLRLVQALQLVTVPLRL